MYPYNEDLKRPIKEENNVTFTAMELTALMLQTSWENNHKFLLKDCYEVAVNVINQVGVDEAMLSVSDEVVEFIDSSVKFVKEKFPNASLEFESVLEMKEDEFLPHAEKLLERYSQGDEEIMRKLLVYPVILDSLDKFKEILNDDKESTRKKDEL